MVYNFVKLMTNNKIENDFLESKEGREKNARKNRSNKNETKLK